VGTSNWQQIPFCIDALMKIAPSRVLDIGVGFGRWGIITREFCDVWFSRIFKDEWRVHLEGVEGFPRSITDYHHSFYNKIHIGDAAEIIPTLPGPWSVTIYGDVLEHFTKEKAHELLSISLERSEYVLINIPIGEEFEQGEAYGNVYERHLSQWEVEDFRPFGLVNHALLQDFQGRPYGAFVLSRNDPNDLKSGLFSRFASYPKSLPASADMNVDASTSNGLVRQVAEQAFELEYIKRSHSYQLAQKLRRNGVLQAAKRLTKGPTPNTLRVRATGEPGKESQGTEVWLLAVTGRPDEPATPWDFVDFAPGWHPRTIDDCSYGRCFMTLRGEASVVTSADPELRFMSHPWSGTVEISFAGRTETIDLSAPTSGHLLVYPGRSPMVPPSIGPGPLTPGIEIKPLPGAEHPPQGAVPGPQADGRRDDPSGPTLQRATPGFTPAHRDFLAQVAKSDRRVIAVHCPKWLGVTSSTRILFEHCYPVPNSVSEDPFTLTDDDIELHASLLAEANVARVVFSGGDESHLRIARRLRQLRPSTTVDMLWHGSYVQFSEDYVWHITKMWIEAAKSGVVRSICTVKAGMEDLFRALGVPSALVLNYVPGDVQAPPVLSDDGHIHAGMWISGAVYRKIPHAMLAAVKMAGNVWLHGAGLDARAREVVEAFGIPAGELHPAPLPHDRLMAAIRRTHLSLYVTFSECCPMLPLESLQLGVPCLVGPVSHLFEDNAFLSERLVVPQPDRADVIARFIERAFAEREEIIAEYARYAPGYNALARRSVEKFIDDGGTLERGVSPWQPANTHDAALLA